jgi:HEAT repeat protein
VELLTGLLHDESPGIRRTAAESLGKIGIQASAVSVLPLLTDPEPAVRAAAAQALGRLDSPSAEAVIVGLTRALEDPDDAVKEAAAIAIGEVEPVSKELAFAVSLVHAPDVRVRRAAVRAFLQVDASLWGPALVSALSDADAEVRQTAVAAIGTSGGPAATTELRKRLANDVSPAVRAEAAYQVGKIGGSEIRSALEGAVAKDPDSGVRRWAKAELRSLRGSD